MRPTNQAVPPHARARAGFSLFELLIVLAIIGLLAGLVLPRLADAFGKGQEKTTQAQMSLLTSAVESFKLNYGRYPSNEEGLDVLVKRPDWIDQADWSSELSKETVPLDGWKRPFVYKLDDGFGFRIISLGADGKSGGEGENADLDNRK
jgi:general secretion pathway protein G